MHFGNPSCIAVQIELELEPYEDKKIVLMLGEEEEKDTIQSIVNKYKNIDNTAEELKREREYWNKLLRKVQIKTPVESMDIMLNGWTMYQTIVSRLYARSGYYQSGGAYGFRDQLQDALCTKYVDKDILKNQIIKHSKHQFEEEMWSIGGMMRLKEELGQDFQMTYYGSYMRYVNISNLREIIVYWTK